MTGSQRGRLGIAIVAINLMGCLPAVAQTGAAQMSQQRSSRIIRSVNQAGEQHRNGTGSIPITHNDLRATGSQPMETVAGNRHSFHRSVAPSNAARSQMEESRASQATFDAQVQPASFSASIKATSNPAALTNTTLTNAVPIDQAPTRMLLPGNQSATEPGTAANRQPPRDEMTISGSSQPAGDQWQPIELPSRKLDELVAATREQAAPQKKNRVSSEQFQKMLTKTAANTMLVIFLAVGILVTRKKWMSRKRQTTQNTDSKSKIQLMDTFKISPKTSLHLLQVCSQRVLVASNENQLVQLMKLASFDELISEEDDPQEEQIPEQQTPTIHEQLAMYLANDQLFKKQ